MVLSTTGFLSSFTAFGKQKAYYEKNSGILNGVVLRYQQDEAAAARILQSLFNNVFQLQSWNKVTIEGLRTFAVKKSLLSVLQPGDSEMIYSSAKNTESGIIGDVGRLEYNELIALLGTLPLRERVLYNAIIIDQIPVKQVSLWTGYSVDYIESTIAYTRKILSSGINNNESK